MTGIDAVGFVARWLAFVGVIMPLGAVLFRGMVVAHAGLPLLDAQRLKERAARVGWRCALLIPPAALARLYFQVGLMRFPDEPWFPFAGKLIAQSTWGYLWLGQLALATLVAVALWRVESAEVKDDRLAAILAALLAVTPSLSSHAMSGHASRWLTLPADMLHLLGAATWLGTLAVMSSAVGLDSGRLMSVLLARFSPLALVGATIVAVSGVVSSLIHVQAVTVLTMTPYGRTLLVKLCIVAGVVALGWHNWRRMTPRVDELGNAAVRRSILIELVLAATVLAATSVLVITPPVMNH